jgi:hypothetical protein
MVIPKGHYVASKSKIAALLIFLSEIMLCDNMERKMHYAYGDGRQKVCIERGE